MNRIENSKMNKIIEKPLYYNEFVKLEQKRIDSTKVNKRFVNYNKEELIEMKRALAIFSEVSPELSDNRGYSPVNPIRHSAR